MKKIKFKLTIVAAILLMVVHAQASLYDITFSSSPLGVSASGWISLTDIPNVDGSYTATLGSITIVGDVSLNATYGLLANPNAPSAVYSPLGYFIYDNSVFPVQTPYLDTYGLLFTGNNLEINIWGNGSGDSAYYTIYGNNGVTYNGNATLTAVPEPTTLISGALLLLPFGAGTIRTLRKRRVF